MDISQYKDYVLAFLLLKYISDKYADQPLAPITIPAGASFADMAALKGTKDIGDQINKAIIAPLAEANQQLSLSDFPDFNDPNKLGSGKEMVDRLTNLIGIFEEPALDFSNNRAEGDAYEFLMRHFATESGKSKGQFYTPSEVSRIMAKVLDIGAAQTNASTTVYDPTCGSGSLLLKVADEANTELSLYGQEKENTTSGQARMNMILHDYSNARIETGDSLISPSFLKNGKLKKFDYAVACPPISLKDWSRNLDAEKDPYDRFTYGLAPRHSGDFAFIQHMIASLNSNGRMAVLISHGPLFRGGAEARIRQALLEDDLIEAIIGLPPGLLGATNIPTCILVCNKNKSADRKNKVFFVNANRDFTEDRRKRFLLPEHVEKIANAFFDEIRENSFILNIQRYVDSSELASLLRQYCDRFEKYQLKDLALEINSTSHDRKFVEKQNSLYVPRIKALAPATESSMLNKNHHHYYQVVLDDRCINQYVAQFLSSTIGQHALAVLVESNLSQMITRAELNECIIALPPLEQQKGNVETHKKLSTLRESIEKINQDLSLNPTSATEFEAQLDSMLQAVGKLSQADQIRSIIRQGESKTVEFKETYNLCLRKETKEDYVETSALKTIVAFFNSEGGTLLIGVSDAPKIVGIERELKQFHKENDDKFLLHLKNKLKSRIGEEFYPFINYDLITVDGCKIVYVRCKQSDSPCFLDKNAFYVRTNPASDKIEGQKLIEYVKNRFEH